MTLKEFVAKNKQEIIRMKVEDCINPEKNFVYLSKSGELKIGRNDLHGYTDQMSFGGYESTIQKAESELAFIMRHEEDVNRVVKVE